MMYRGRSAQAGMGVVVGVKLAATALIVLVAFGLHSGRHASSSGVPRAALAAEPGAPTGAHPESAVENVTGSATQDASKEPAKRARPVAIPGDAPSLKFAAQSRTVAELLEAIRHRSAELAKREAALKQRETTMAAAASDLEKKIVRLESLTATTSGGATGPSSMEELGKIYGAMKAEESAPLLDRLDDETVRAIFSHMKQKQISAVLPLMNPDKAVKLTNLLSGR